jgi:hypothetical protein
MNRHNSYLIAFIFLLLTYLQSFSQIDSTHKKWRLNDNYVKNNVVCGELFGGNFGLSINYERAIINKKHFMLNGRIGLGTLLLMWSSTYSMSGNFGGKYNFLELGFGRTDYIVLVPGIYSNGPSNFFYPLIGYRYQKNFVFKFQFIGLVNHENNQLYKGTNRTGIIFGLSFGKAF